jgi:hypothetical protein
MGTPSANVSILAGFESAKRKLIDEGRALTIANLASVVGRDLQAVLDGGTMTDFIYRGANDGHLRFTATLSMPWFSPRLRDDYPEGERTSFESPPALKLEYHRALHEAAERFNRASNSKISVDGITLVDVWWTHSTINSAREQEECIRAVKERIASLSPEEISAATFMQVGDHAMVPTGMQAEEGELYAVLTLDDQGRCVQVAEPSDYPDAFNLMRGQEHDAQLSASAAFR